MSKLLIESLILMESVFINITMSKFATENFIQQKERECKGSKFIMRTYWGAKSLSDIPHISELDLEPYK